MRSRCSNVRSIALATGLTIALSGALAPQALAASNDEVVVRFAIDPATLTAVGNSIELVDILHQELRVEASSPLDYEIVVHLLGNIYQNRDQAPHAEGSGIMLSLEKGKPQNDRIKDLRFYTYGGFSESEAWDFFRGKIEEALLYSMNSNGLFEADDDGTVWLAVVDVEDGSVIIEPDESNMVLELTAELNYRDGSRFGRKEAPDGYQQILQTVQLVLSPAQIQAGAATAAEQATNDGEAAAAESGGILGVYGYDESGLRIEMSDGQYVMSDIRKSPPVYMPLTPIGPNHFSVDYNGFPSKLKFSMDDEGNAFAMSVEREGTEFKLPRK